MRLLSRRTTCPLALATALFASPLLGQGAELGSFEWTLGAASPSWCVHFLMDPKDADNEFSGDLKPVGATYVTDLHPALKRAITDEPKFAEWVPAELCTVYLQSITYEQKRYERGDKNTPLAAFYWGIAATAGDAPWDGRYRLRVLGANNYGLVRASQVKGIQMEKVTIDQDSIIGNDEDRIASIKLNGATIQFTGHFNPDSTGAAVEKREMNGFSPGQIQTVWNTKFSYQPTSFGTMAGSLQIFGKRGLAKALNGSPIRLIGKAFAGGEGKLEFVRMSTRR